jgi:hypothetical protein
MYVYIYTDSEGNDSQAYANSLPIPTSMERTLVSVLTTDENDNIKRLLCSDILILSKELKKEFIMNDINRVGDNHSQKNENKITNFLDNDKEVNYSNMKIKKIYEKNLVQTSVEAKEINSRKIRLLHEIGML